MSQIWDPSKATEECQGKAVVSFWGRKLLRQIQVDNTSMLC